MKNQKKRKPTRTAKAKAKAKGKFLTLDVTTFTYELGIPVRDVLTGFAGVITGRVQYLTGCTQYLVQPRGLRDGRHQESFWIDEGKLARIRGKARVTLPSAPNGGPQQHEPAKH
jgi:hypothetical protein